MTDYRITPVKHWNSNWAWWATREFDYGGDTPTFYAATALHYNLAAGERLAVWGTAADTDNWNDFTTVTIGTPDISFVHGSAFPAGLIYVAALPMYPFSRVQRKVNEWELSEWVGETISSTNLKVGTATARTVPDESGRTAPALPFYGFKVTGDRVGNKNKAILSAYNHPSETPGAYELEGALDYVLGTSAEAEVLRDWFEFYVYPCLNPQGVWAGWFRSSPQTPTEDNNRLWNTSGTNEAVDAFKAAMSADTGGTINVGLDYHSEMSLSDIHGVVHTGDTGGNYEYFRAEMAALDADFNLSESAVTEGLRYWQKSLGATLAITVEQGGEIARGVTDYKALGENTMKALHEMLIDGRFTYGP